MQLFFSRSAALVLSRTAVLAALLALSACTPTVQVAAPTDPITINLNVKIQHEILVKVDREIDNLLEENSDLF
ncbi:YnbE family lipoprotein [Nitrincola schmidtii]|uniref:YnbE family lipoprotein n=1 Tax=Nitrincola schmidtii TaxID=1730894 RepID=UPI00124F6FFE|nr:YnbE family lipoprotein [Nitrincola schmidtii]